MHRLTLPSPLVSVAWLADHLHHPDLLVLDAHMPPPGSTENGPVVQIPGARRFDFDGEIKDAANPLPHMMPTPDQFERQVRALGVNQTSLIVVYDRLGIFSAARGWWMFRAMGHAQVAVLDGGLPAWQAAGHAVEAPCPYAGATGDFVAAQQSELFCDADAVQRVLTDGSRPVLDARSAERFAGQAAEPRPGVRSGHMPGALNLPFADLLENGRMKPVAELQAQFAERLVPEAKPVFSCGSGVTACILALGAELAGWQGLTVYDGSWSEWGADLTRPVVQDPA